MTSEICECGHHLDDHDFDSLNCLGCSKCQCSVFIEDEDED